MSGVKEGGGAFGVIHPDAPPELARFAFILGEWKIRTRGRWSDGPDFTSTGTWIGRYVLDGYAIADEARVFDADGRLIGMGVTYRSVRPTDGRWVMQWFSALDSTWEELRTDDLPPVEFGDDFVRFRNHGFFPRITFEKITDDAFRWVGETTEDDGRTWMPTLWIEATRIR